MTRMSPRQRGCIWEQQNGGEENGEKGDAVALRRDAVLGDALRDRACQQHQRDDERKAQKAEEQARRRDGRSCERVDEDAQRHHREAEAQHHPADLVARHFAGDQDLSAHRRAGSARSGEQRDRHEIRQDADCRDEHVVRFGDDRVPEIGLGQAPARRAGPTKPSAIDQRGP
jgi:hypothetical protein